MMKEINEPVDLRVRNHRPLRTALCRLDYLPATRCRTAIARGFLRASYPGSS